MNHTFVLLKPDCVERGLVGAAINRLEWYGQITAAYSKVLTEEDVRKLYVQFTNPDKDFFKDLTDFMVSGLCILLRVSSIGDTVSDVREEALEFRKRNAQSFRRNLIHASDSAENAARELGIFFGSDS